MMSKWWAFREPTSDEVLVDEIKAAVENLSQLGKEAKKRGINVWVKDHGRVIRPDDLVFDEAYRIDRKQIG